MDNKLDILLRRQKVLADFGNVALQSENLDEVLTDAVVWWAKLWRQGAPGFSRSQRMVKAGWCGCRLEPRLSGKCGCP